MNAVRVRREPPAFRELSVDRTEVRTPRLVRVTLAGDDIEALAPAQPAASVRLLLPPAGRRDLVMPAWNGNEFLLPDGSRPPIRTLTPLRVDPAAGTLDVEVVVHDGGALPAWATAARRGDPVAASGPGRGYAIDTGAGDFVLAGDETAVPAIVQLLGHLPAAARARVLVEVAEPSARQDLSRGTGAEVRWLDLPPGAAPGTALVEAVRAVEVGPRTRVWVAGEAAAVQRIRTHLFQERGLPRSQAAIRGYWKHGRTGD